MPALAASAMMIMLKTPANKEALLSRALLFSYWKRGQGVEDVNQG
jgi:hypothetical protein